tara:strand:+ start:836 stop:2626 length:1791 start_codon:yes stop_codon:yes gene_type:complete
MSYEVANEIVNMYMQSNTRRINSAMETAYQEALSTYQSDVEARKAALGVLKLEQRSYDDYLKILARNMKDLRSGNINIAKKAFAAEQRNLRRQHAAKEANRKSIAIADRKNQQAMYKWRKDNTLRRYQATVDSAKLKKSFEDDLDKNHRKYDRAARKHAKEVVYSDNVLSSSVDGILGGMSDVISKEFAKGKPSENLIKTYLYSKNFNKFIDQAIAQASDKTKSPQGLLKDKGDEKEYKFDRTREEYKKAGIMYHVLNNAMNTFDISYVGDDKDIQREKFKTIMKNILQSKVLNGRFQDVADIPETEIERREDAEYQLKLQELSPILKKTTSDILKAPYIPPPPKQRAFITKAFQEKVPEQDTTERQYIDDLRKTAEPVFEQLRADDDTPFQLTEEEIATVGEAAVNAYKELQIERTQTPLISLEERRLLDPLALERQLNLMRQGQRVRSIQPELDSFEQVRSRAGEILESPKRRSTANAGTPLEQRFYATQRESARLSYESDEDLRSKGVPEALGVSLYKETFDPLNSTFLNDNTYQSVVDRIQKNTKTPEEQMRAISAFDSRVMAQQRTKAPIIMKDGSRNREYLEALKALGNK